MDGVNGLGAAPLHTAMSLQPTDAKLTTVATLLVAGADVNVKVSPSNLKHTHQAAYISGMCRLYGAPRLGQAGHCRPVRSVVLAADAAHSA